MPETQVGAKLLCQIGQYGLDSFQTDHSTTDRRTGNDPPLA